MKRKSPDARTVARRAIALYFVTLRAVSAQDAALIHKWRRRMTPAERRAESVSSRSVHRSYMATTREWQCDFSPRERAFMAHADAMHLPERDHIDMTWRCESLAVLAWALRFGEKLAALHRASQVVDRFDFMGRDPVVFLRQARLRSLRELAYAREQVAARLRRDCGRQAAEVPFRWDVIGIARLGREYYGDDWSPAVAIARERLHALNWLCGYAPGNRWDDTPEDATENPAVVARGVPRITAARATMHPHRLRRTRRRIAIVEQVPANS